MDRPDPMARLSRVITSRAFAYVVFVLFLVDGVVALADGRLLRGVANIAVGAAIAHWLPRRPTGHSRQGVARRQQWARSHPVLGSVVMGAGWGLAMGVATFATKEIPLWPSLAVSVGVGVLFFGPLLTWFLRRGSQDARPPA